MPFERRTLQIARPIVSRMSDIPLPDDDLFESVEDLVNVLERTSLLLSDSSVSSMRLVINPEKMVIKEAQRAYAYLNLYGYAVDSVVCNRVFPQELQDAYFSGWLRRRRNAIWPSSKKHSSLLPISRIPFFEEEVMGQKMLQRMAATLFGDVLERGGDRRPHPPLLSGGAAENLRPQWPLHPQHRPAPGRQRGGQPAPQRRRRAHRPHRQLETQYRPAHWLGALADRRRQIRRRPPQHPLPQRRRRFQ